MKSWPIDDAKARFNELIETCLKEGPQVVTQRGAETAVLVPMYEWRRLHPSSKPTLKELLLSEEGRGDLPLADRDRLRRREPDRLV